MERFVRVLAVFFWVAATLLVALLITAGLGGYDFVVGLLGSERLESVDAVLLGTMTFCSGLITWLEFRANPAEESEYGEWTGKATFYATIFGIALFLSFYFIPVAYFDP